MPEFAKDAPPRLIAIVAFWSFDGISIKDRSVDIRIVALDFVVDLASEGSHGIRIWPPTGPKQAIGAVDRNLAIFLAIVWLIIELASLDGSDSSLLPLTGLTPKNDVRE